MAALSYSLLFSSSLPPPIASPVVLFLPFPYFFYNYPHDDSEDLFNFRLFNTCRHTVHFCFFCSGLLVPTYMITGVWMALWLCVY